MANQDLVQMANALLRANGFTWSGRHRKEVVREQAAFERRLITTPTNGKPRIRHPGVSAN